MAKLRKTPRSSTASGTGNGTGTGTGTPPHSPSTSTRATAATTPSHTLTSRGSAPIPLRSAAHLNAPVGLSETVVAALDDVVGGGSTSTSPGAGLTTAAACPPAGSSSASTSSPSSPRLYRTRIASTSTIASQEGETLSTLSTSSGSAGTALSKLRSRLELDQAAREEAATRGASTTKLRKRSSRGPVPVKESDRLNEATMDQNDGTAIVAEADAHEARDPPDVPLEHVDFPGQVVPESVQVQPISREPTSSGPIQLPVEETLAPVSEPPPPEPDFALRLDLEPNRPPLSTSRSLSSSSAVSLLFAPVRLGWRVTTAPARITYRLAAFGVGVVGSGISLGQKVAQLGLETATEAGSSLGNLVAANTATSNGISGPEGKGESRPTALLRLRDTVSPTRLALAALQVSLGMVLASVLVARALVELAVTKVCDQVIGGRVE